MNQEMRRFSASISTSFEKLFRIGGAYLVFIYVGFLLMFIGHVVSGPLSTWLFLFGSVLMMACLFVFLVMQIGGRLKTTQLLKENEEILVLQRDFNIDGITVLLSQL